MGLGRLIKGSQGVNDSLGCSLLALSWGILIEVLLRGSEKGNLAVRGRIMDAEGGTSDFEKLLLRYVLCITDFVNVDLVLKHVHPTSSVSMYADDNNR